MRPLLRGGACVLIIGIIVALLVLTSSGQSQWTGANWQQITASTRLPQHWGRFAAMTPMGSEAGSYLLTFEDSRGVIRTVAYSPHPSTTEHFRLVVFAIDRY